MLYWRIIFPKGDRSRLDMAQVYDFEDDDYTLASRNKFGEDEQVQCYEYMIELAKKNNLTFRPKRGHNIFLD